MTVLPPTYAYVLQSEIFVSSCCLGAVGDTVTLEHPDVRLTTVLNWTTRAHFRGYPLRSTRSTRTHPHALSALASATCWHVLP